MRTSLLILSLLFLLPTASFSPLPLQDSRRQGHGFEKQLEPVAFLLGKHRGEGRSLMGAYRETMSATWALGHTAIILQSGSTAGGMVVFQDMRVFTWDPIQKRIRVRQFANGGVCTYNLKVDAEGSKVILEQDDLEGMKRPEWRYTFEKEKGGFSYQVDQKSGDEFRKYVAGKLKKQ